MQPKKKLSIKRETLRHLQVSSQRMIPLQSPKLQDKEGGSTTTTTITIFCTPICLTPQYPTVTPTLRRAMTATLESFQDSCLSCGCSDDCTPVSSLPKPAAGQLRGWL